MPKTENKICFPALSLSKMAKASDMDSAFRAACSPSRLTSGKLYKLKVSWMANSRYSFFNFVMAFRVGGLSTLDKGDWR